MLKKLLILSFVVVGIVFASQFASAAPISESELVPEDKQARCEDGIDNDGDDLIDASDTDCEGKIIVAENTLALCTDGIDNDLDDASDIADVDCAPYISAENTAEKCSDSIDNDLDDASDVADTDCAQFVTPQSSPENTSETCTDGIDNDLDDASDSADIDCAPFVTPASTPENTIEFCNDGIDNDLDDATDSADADCAQFVTPEEQTSNDNGGTTSGSRRSGGGSSKKTTTIPTTPAVLGASTGPNGEVLSCAPYLTTFMRMGQKNDVAEVKKLQAFLNETVGSNLPLTGFFGPMTDSAVKKLQAMHSDQILKPWGANVGPTGYAYKMTQWFINSSLCKGTTIPKPILN